MTHVTSNNQPDCSKVFFARWGRFLQTANPGCRKNRAKESGKTSLKLLTANFIKKESHKEGFFLFVFQSVPVWRRFVFWKIGIWPFRAGWGNIQLKLTLANTRLKPDGDPPWWSSELWITGVITPSSGLWKLSSELVGFIQTSAKLQWTLEENWGVKGYF